jgi:hypothetical protein
MIRDETSTFMTKLLSVVVPAVALLVPAYAQQDPSSHGTGSGSRAEKISGGYAVTQIEPAR